MSEEKKGIPKKKSAKWLRALEAQSWQAELLISGLLVAGLLQVPDLLINLLQGYMIESTGLGHAFYGFASMIFLSGINSLIICFGCHFLFRAIWIALLGLNSVYPEGINSSSTMGSGPKYWEKMKEKYPSLSTYNQELDHTCSLIFSVATITVIMMTSLAVIVILAFKIFQLLISFFPELAGYTLYIGAALYGLFLVFSIAVQQLPKKFPNNKRIGHWAVRYGNLMSLFFSLYIFRKPIGYISGILTSNSNSKSKLGIIIIIIASIFLGILAASQTGTNPIYRYFDTDRYFTFNDKPHRKYNFNYENLRDPSHQIFTPIISSDVVDDAFLELFIPTIEREKAAMDIVDLDILTRLKTKRPQRDSFMEANLPKYIAFNQIFINGKLYPNVDFNYYLHANAGEHGIQAYIPTDEFINGRNILEVRKNYFSEDGKQKIVKIPFLYSNRRKE